MGERIDFPGKSDSPVLPEAGTLISRLAPLLNRPLLIGGAAVLASLLCCNALAQTASFSEVKAAHAPLATAPRAHHRAAQSDELPPLFLAILGLAALALSQTRPSEETKPRPVDSCAGKNVAPGQKLPEVTPTPAGSGVIAGEHHDDVVGLKPVVRLGMLHK